MKKLATTAATISSLLYGCATPIQHTAGVDMPSYVKSNSFYNKANLPSIEARANAGEASAQLEMAMIYSGFIGDGSISRDNKLSNYWMEKSAAQDDMLSVAVLSSRHYQYDKWSYPKNIELADKLAFHAYELYSATPPSAWDAYETSTIAGVLVWMADYHLEDKNFAQEWLCKALALKPKDKNAIAVAHQDLRKIGRKCD